MDYRHCDGPNCEQILPLDDRVMLEVWITLDRGPRWDFVRSGDHVTPRYLHFHNDKCLREWTSENTRV